MSLTNIFKHLPGQHSQQSHAGQLSPSDYVDQLSSEHQQAIKNYTGSDYKPINRNLRDGTPNHPDNEKTVKLLDEAMENAPSITQKTLYRALGKSPEEIGIVEGQTFTDKGFGSTSRDAGFMYKLGLPTRVKIKVPKGTKGLAVEKISHKKEEKEILLPRNSSYKVTKVSQNEFGKYDVEVELLP